MVRDYMRVYVCCSVHLWASVRTGQICIRGEAFPPRPRGRVKCKTRAPVACCGNAAQSQLFSVSASREAGCTSHSPDAFADTYWWLFGGQETLRGGRKHAGSAAWKSKRIFKYVSSVITCHCKTAGKYIISVFNQNVCKCCILFHSSATNGLLQPFSMYFMVILSIC